MALDHAQTGAPGHHAKLIGIGPLRLEDRRDAILHGGGATKYAANKTTGASATIQRRQNQIR